MADKKTKVLVVGRCEGKSGRIIETLMKECPDVLIVREEPKTNDLIRGLELDSVFLDELHVPVDLIGQPRNRHERRKSTKLNRRKS